MAKNRYNAKYNTPMIKAGFAAVASGLCLTGAGIAGPFLTKDPSTSYDGTFLSVIGAGITITAMGLGMIKTATTRKRPQAQAQTAQINDALKF